MKAVHTALAMAFGLLVASAAAASSDLAYLNALIIDDPANVELNLDYALVAEGQGKYRLALAAYERILLNHPDNEAARRGLVRIRRIIEPPFTRFVYEAGGSAQSNPMGLGGGPAGLAAYGRIGVTDERRIGTVRWRSEGNLLGEVHTASNNLNYGRAWGSVGPLIDLGASLATFRPSAGGALASLAGGFYYAEANANADFEARNMAARFRAGFRTYDSSLTATSGFFLNASGQYTFPNVIHPGDALSVAPQLRWNGINGVFNNGVSDFSPGRYLVGKVRFGYDKALSRDINVGASLTLGHRRFLVDVAPGGAMRSDITVTPGASVLFKELLGVQTDVRADYRLEWQRSNDPTKEFANHVLTLALILRR